MGSQSGMPSTIAPSSRMPQSGMPSTIAPSSRMSQSGMPSTIAPSSRMSQSFGPTSAPSSRMPQSPTPSAPSSRMQPSMRQSFRRTSAPPSRVPQSMPSFAPSSRAPKFTGPSTIAPESEFSPRTKLRNALASSRSPFMPRKDASLANGYTGFKRKFNSEKRDSGYKKNKENSLYKGNEKNSDSTGRFGSGKRSSYKKNPPRK